MESFKNLDVELPEINLDGVDKNNLNFNLSYTHFQQLTKSPNIIKSNLPINQSAVFSNASIPTGSAVVSEK
jgi:hypothetical protein